MEMLGEMLQAVESFGGSTGLIVLGMVVGKAIDAVFSFWTGRMTKTVEQSRVHLDAVLLAQENLVANLFKRIASLEAEIKDLRNELRCHQEGWFKAHAP